MKKYLLNKNYMNTKQKFKNLKINNKFLNKNAFKKINKIKNSKISYKKY